MSQPHLTQKKSKEMGQTTKRKEGRKEKGKLSKCKGRKEIQRGEVI